MSKAGIDYSMSCPAVTVFTKDGFKSFYISSKKKYEGQFGKHFTGFLMPDYNCNAERFDIISDMFLQVLTKGGVKDVNLEGYSFGSTGSRVFDIGENGGVLKNKVWKNKMVLATVTPGQVKKFARSFLPNEREDDGKLVKMTKAKMVEAFILATGVDIYVDFGVDKPIGKKDPPSPLHDIADSYFIGRLSA